MTSIYIRLFTYSLLLCIFLASAPLVNRAYAQSAEIESAAEYPLFCNRASPDYDNDKCDAHLAGAPAVATLDTSGLPSVCDPNSPSYNMEECETYLDFTIEQVYDATTFEEAIANKATLVRKRTIKDCFIGNLSCQLRATNDAESVGAARPATFAYTINNDGDDSIAVSAAVKATHALKPGFLALKAEWQKNTQQKKEQDNLNLGVGYDFEIFRRRQSPAEQRITQRLTNNETVGFPEGLRALNDFYSIIVANSIDYNRKGIFGDATAEPCVADPTLRACGDQFLETIRFSTQASPYWPGLESYDWSNNDQFYWVLSPAATVFYDRAINNDVELLSGDLVNGGVFGVVGRTTLAISPGIYQNRFELALTGQIIQALDRDMMRLGDFEKSSRLFSASLQYALSDNAFVRQKKSDYLIPAFSITYTNGSNSLKGRESQDTIVFGLSLKY